MRTDWENVVPGNGCIIWKLNEVWPLKKDSVTFLQLLKKTTLWPVFMDGVQLPEGYNPFKEAVYFLPFSPQTFLVLILSTTDGWKAESTLEPTQWFWTQDPWIEIPVP